MLIADNILSPDMLYAVNQDLQWFPTGSTLFVAKPQHTALATNSRRRYAATK